MTEPDKPEIPGLMDIFDGAPMWTRVLLGIAVGVVTLGMVAWALGIVEFTAPEVGDGNTVSRACLDHFEEIADARAKLPTPSASAAVWLGTDFSGAFEDCAGLTDWNNAASRYPGSFSAGDEVDEFVRTSCSRSEELATSPTCLSLD